MHKRRVVVTGIGIVAPNGTTVDTFWDSLCAGKSAAGKLTRFEPKGMPCRLACEVNDFSFEEYVDPKKINRLDRSLLFAISAAKKSLTDSQLNLNKISADRIGVVEGTSVSGLDNTLKSHERFLEIGYKAIKPSNLVTAFCGGGSSEIAIALGIQGQATTICTACSAGNDALAHGKREIEDDVADVMIAGAAEAPIVAGYFAIFAAAGVMTRELNEPTQAMRPFDERRDGFILGEGSAFLVLEEYNHAVSRGAKIYAELAGTGRACDSYHPIALHPEGRGTVRSITMALRDGGVRLDEVDYVNVHGSATASNDSIETLALKHVFGNYAHGFSVSATKPITGHLMGASAALEAAICALSISRSVIPPTINLTNPEAGCDLDYVVDGARPYPVRAALNLNAGFGGKQSAIIFKRVEGA